ncbi:hypothetical protein SAMN05192551_104246 [Tindallia magadiensis]|uniref:Uncharacterized protein n=1 Tax=Tindallia magadiensis TaxID=69895 RepID=A0A1I3E598_9FIRM|nr:hypothetical protein [Tindallia magadiensis]SFH94157.1 hypothetical protein SAMN05192551_104246 [Tindallia magadiensis]
MKGKLISLHCEERKNSWKLHENEEEERMRTLALVLQVVESVKKDKKTHVKTQNIENYKR